jgi:hypothetical protein
LNGILREGGDGCADASGNAYERESERWADQPSHERETPVCVLHTDLFSSPADSIRQITVARGRGFVFKPGISCGDVSWNGFGENPTMLSPW